MCLVCKRTLAFYLGPTSCYKMEKMNTSRSLLMRPTLPLQTLSPQLKGLPCSMIGRDMATLSKGGFGSFQAGLCRPQGQVSILRRLHVSLFPFAPSMHCKRRASYLSGIIVLQCSFKLYHIPYCSLSITHNNTLYSVLCASGICICSLLRWSPL